MSQVRRTTRIKRIRVTAQPVATAEELVPVVDLVASAVGVLAGAAWVAGKLVAKGAIVAAKAASVGAKAVTESAAAAQALQIRPVVPAALRAAVKAPTSGAAVARAWESRLVDAVAASNATVTRAAASEIVAEAKAIASTSSPVEREQKVGALIDKIAVENQSVLVKASVFTAQAACQAIGFEPIRVEAERGYVLAADSQGQEVRVDVLRDNQGGTAVALDADGFQGEGCQEVLDKLEAEMKSRGMDFDSSERVWKRRRNQAVIRAPKRATIRQGGRAPGR